MPPTPIPFHRTLFQTPSELALANQGSSDEAPARDVRRGKEPQTESSLERINRQFSEAILQDPLPKHYAPLAIEEYSGATDPNDHLGGDSNRAKKSHARQLRIHAVGYSQERAQGPEISFGPRDLEGFEVPHDDTLIIQAHELHVRPDARPVKQRKWDISAEQNVIIRVEIEKLLEADHIQEVQFLSWLANVVLVSKPGNKWRGYHQVSLAHDDQEKVSFIMADGTYCYNIMPFGLENVGATYQRLMNKVFRKQIGRNLEKCLFEAKSDRFLGYIVTERGIEVNPSKVKALQDMPPPRNLKEV
ncbi:uncharacterized protein LOC121980107 [Zingiber officinale]|uniref:uncharacterized protein LOC121980107 n=1 Tax=Zingiber officinale TaxID=94328 RepID=UPI001C4D92C4|nr:uncharacterized protein LOC121980107 [Zingiber officinale]